MKKHKKRISLFLAAAFMVLLLPIGAIQVKAGGGSGVAIDPSSLELTLGGEDAEKTLTATVTDIDGKTVSDVEWSIDEDDGVVELSSPATGETVTVTALKAGTAKIIATVTPDVGEAQTAECMVTVNPAPIPVTGVSLNKTTLSLVEGADETLTATVDPANADDVTVSWSSSNTSVATVDENGKVTAVGAGGAIITVTSDADETKKATCNVTVNPAPISVTGVSLNKTTLSLVEGADETLTPIFDPTNATNKAVTWESSNTSVATVGNDGKVTAVSVGTATITVTTTDGSKTATCEVTVTCSHNIVEVSAKDATCTEDGNIAHYKCTKCEKLFEDALGATEITDASSVVISATHTLTLVSEVPATCTENGVMAHYKCDVCNKLFSDTTGTQEVQANELVIPAGHNIVKVDAKAPTCIADGNIVHYKCTKCGKLFEDGQGVSEITDISSVVLAKTEHNWSTKWSSDDTHHWHECADCGTVKDKATHTPGAQATQTTPQTCTVCGHIITPIISAKPEIINDESQPDTWTPKSTGGLAFRSTAELADFISVSVNGKIVDRENYTLTEGSTIVTLKPEFLATLPDGKYTIEINSTTGVAKTVFTVEDSPVAKGSSPYANPNTGDTTKIISSIALLTLSGAGAVFFKKKREE